MSEENVELVRRAILGWNERGVNAFIEVLDPEVEWHPPSVEVTSVDQDAVLAVVHIVATTAKFGRIDAEWAWLSTIRDGKAIRGETFVAIHRTGETRPSVYSDRPTAASASSRSLKMSQRTTRPSWN